MSHHLPRVVPVDDPDTYLAGGLLSTPTMVDGVTVTCQACQRTQVRLKVLANSVISTPKRDAMVTRYLAILGWERVGRRQADVCPECVNTYRDVCPVCQDFTGGHASTCPTQIPGALR